MNARVNLAATLLRSQSERFAALDPLLPPAPPPPDGDVLTAALPDGERVAGVLTVHRSEPNSLPALWSAVETWELHPLLGGGDAGQGVDALLRQWRRILDRRTPGADSSCLVTWPSRDTEASRPLLDHGFVPLSVLAVRTAAPPPAGEPDPDLVIRRADIADLDIVVPLALAELEYSARVGASIPRPGAAELKHAAAADHLLRDDPVWLAERDGMAVGLAECWLTVAEPSSWAASRLPPGKWGYVNCLSVLPELRGSGVGRELMAHAHRGLRSLGAAGTFLYYNPPNPLASVFWARQGYRPLWTVWEVRPAAAMR